MDKKIEDLEKRIELFESVIGHNLNIMGRGAPACIIGALAGLSAHYAENDLGYNENMRLRSEIESIRAELLFLGKKGTIYCGACIYCPPDNVAACRHPDCGGIDTGIVNRDHSCKYFKIERRGK